MPRDTPSWADKALVLGRWSPGASTPSMMRPRTPSQIRTGSGWES